MELLAKSPEAHVMAIVDTDAGSEVLQTHPSRIWSFGVLAVAEQMLDAQYRELRDAESRKKAEARPGWNPAHRTSHYQAFEQHSGVARSDNQPDNER